MSLDVLLKCDFSEAELPSDWIQNVLFSIPSDVKIIIIGLHTRMLVFGELSRNTEEFTLLGELKFQRNSNDARCGPNVYVVGLENGELLFLHENNKILLCIKTGFDSVRSIHLTSCGENLCVLYKTTIIYFNLDDVEGVLSNSFTYLSDCSLQSYGNTTFQYTMTIRYRLLTIPTDGESRYFSCLSKYQVGIFDSLVRKFAFESQLRDDKMCISPIQTRWITAGSNPFISFSFLNENADPEVSHFASFVYQEAKRAMFGIKKYSSNDPESLVVTWSQQKDSFMYPTTVCNSLSKIPLSLSHGLADSRRHILSSGVAISPDHHWLAIPDSLGRVLLVDACRERVVRMWKGYRDAEVAFLEVCDSETPYIGYRNKPNNSVRKTLCLLIHAPHLHSLELWCLIHGPRIVSWDVVEPVRLIQTERQNYMNTTRSNEFNLNYYQAVLLDSSGSIYTIDLNAGLCLSDTNTEAAVDYQEYKILQKFYKTLEQCSNNSISGLHCSDVTDLLVEFRTTQWFQRAINYLLNYPDLNPQMILNIVTLYTQLMEKDNNTNTQVNNINVKICSNVKDLVNFYLNFYSLYDDTNEVKKLEFTKTSHRICVEFIADLLCCDLEDAEHCLQLYDVCGSILPSSSSSVGKPLSIQMFLNSFRYAFISNNESENESQDSPEHNTKYVKQFHLPIIRSDNCRKTLTDIGSFIFRPYMNGLQNFNSFQTIIELSDLDPKLLLFSFTLFMLNEDNYLNLPILIDRIHHMYCYIIYRILVELLSLLPEAVKEDRNNDGEENKGKCISGNVKNQTNFLDFLDIKYTKSKQLYSMLFELTFKQIYSYCLDSYHLSSAYLIVLVIRCILFQIWQTFESEENILKVLYDYTQRPEFTIHTSSENFSEIGSDSASQELHLNKNTVDTELHSLSMSSKLFNCLTSNLQHLVDKWHQTCAQLEDILTVGLILLCPMNLKKEFQDSHHSYPYTFYFNLRYVLTHGRSYLTGVFSSWIVKNSITPEQVLSFYQRICAKTLPVEDENANDLITCDPAHIRQVIFSLAYKRLPFTLELDTILSTVCWIHFQCWLNNLEHINHLISCIEFISRFSSAGTMIAQGLGTMIWNKGLINWIKPILAIGRGDKTLDKYRDSFPHILDVALCLIDFFRIYSNACQRAEVVPVFSVETEWSDFDTCINDKSLQFNDKAFEDELFLDLDAQSPIFDDNAANSMFTEVSTGDSCRKLLVQDAVNQPVPNMLSIISWEQLIIVASSFIIFGRPEKFDKSSNRQTTDLKFYSPIDFFPSQDLHMLMSPDNPNWVSIGVGNNVDDDLVIRRRFFLYWLIEKCVACLSLLPNSQRCTTPLFTSNEDIIRSVNHQSECTFGAVDIYRRFSSAAFTLANHWGFPKDTVVIQHIVSLFEANLDDQAQLFLSKVQEPSNLAVRLLFIVGRRVADRCYGPGHNNIKQRLRLRVFIPLTIEAWLRGLLPPISSLPDSQQIIDHDPQFTSSTTDVKTLTFLIDYVIQHLPQYASQWPIAEELRDIIQAIVQLDTE
ncbi:unnamed protein product [Schistosoma rodhaini]|uniref:Rab3-GAP regulatory subunit N-terminal domain-containing protein n=1 Tax=Schistosoma rodhaini TaxID=6188 RepID=A0AA85FIS4_9TREM|nr:unnamed protein product [Schistosoma rodhaini]